MNDERTPGDTPTGEPIARPLTVTLLGVIVAIEALVMAGLVVWLGVETVMDQPDYLVTAIAILVLAAIAALFLVFVAIGTFRMQPWTRAATLVWQIFQVVAAIAAFQGIIGSANVGWFLLAPAIAAIVLLFTPSAVAATRR